MVVMVHNNLIVKVVLAEAEVLEVLVQMLQVVPALMVEVVHQLQ
jgi:hypothetical protein